MCCLALMAHAADAPQMVLEIRDYFTMPPPGKLEFRTQNNSAFARINTMREEPGPIAIVCSSAT